LGFGKPVRLHATIPIQASGLQETTARAVIDGKKAMTLCGPRRQPDFQQMVIEHIGRRFRGGGRVAAE
jgi:hypothetical protein